MANGARGGRGDKTRGTGPEKETVAEPPGVDADPGQFANEGSDSNTPDPARGGCMKFGWGCLPVLAIIAIFPAGLFF